MRKAILNALQDGPATPLMLATTIGDSKEAVSLALEDLLSAGEVTKQGAKFKLAGSPQVTPEPVKVATLETVLTRMVERMKTEPVKISSLQDKLTVLKVLGEAADEPVAGILAEIYEDLQKVGA